MGISVSCPVCQQTFVDIDEAMIGKKARCTCGTVVLLVAEDPLILNDPADTPLLATAVDHLAPRPSEQPKAKSRTKTKSRPKAKTAKPKIQRPDVLNPLDEDLFIAEPVGLADLELIDDPVVAEPLIVEPIVDRLPVLDPIPEVEIKIEDAIQPAVDDPNQSTTTAKSKLKRSKKRSTKPRKKTKPDKPVVNDSFADVDDILNGGIDASPIRSTPNPRPASVPAPPASTVRASEQTASPPANDVEDRRNESPALAAITSMVGGAAGFLFGTTALATRNFPLTDTPLGWLGEPLFGMYQAAYGSGAIEGGFRTLFLGFGWALTVVSIVALVAGFSLAIRGLIRLITGKGAMGWARGFAAIVGVVGLFLVLAILLTQYAHHDHLQAELDRIGGGAVGLVQDLENVKVNREIYVAEKQRFSFALMMFAVLPITMFLAAVVNLFCDRD